MRCKVAKEFARNYFWAVCSEEKMDRKVKKCFKKACFSIAKHADSVQDALYLFILQGLVDIEQVTIPQSLSEDFPRKCKKT